MDGECLPELSGRVMDMRVTYEEVDNRLALEPDQALLSEPPPLYCMFPLPVRSVCFTDSTRQFSTFNLSLSDAVKTMFSLT